MRAALALALLVAPLCGGCFDFDALRAPSDMSAAVDSGSDDGSTSAFAFDASWPTHNSLYYGDHDRAAATLTFTDTADSVACSHDGGNTWAACDSPNTLVFTPDDYDSGHVVAVKLSKSGQPDEVHRFNPSVDLPGLHFYVCDQVVSANESMETFYARLAPGRVICLKEGVEIDYTPFDAGVANSTTGLFLDASNASGLKVLGVENSRATFASSGIGGNQGAFISMSGALTGVVLANLALHCADGNPISFDPNGGGNAFSNLDLKVLGGGNDDAILIGGGKGNVFYNVDSDTQNSPGTPNLRVTGDATLTMTGGNLVGRDDTSTLQIDGPTATVTISGAAISQTTTAVSTKVAAVALLDGTLTMNGGSVQSGDIGLYLGGDGQPVTANVTSVTVQARTGASVGYQSTVTLSGLTIKSTGIGIKINGAQLHLDNTLLERLDATGDPGAAIDATLQVLISSTQNGNHFCDQNPSGANKFSAALTLESGAMNAGNFDLSKQVNLGMIDQCP